MKINEIKLLLYTSVFSLEAHVSCQVSNWVTFSDALEELLIKKLFVPIALILLERSKFSSIDAQLFVLIDVVFNLHIFQVVHEFHLLIIRLSSSVLF